MDGPTDRQTDGGDYNIPFAFLKKYADKNKHHKQEPKDQPFPIRQPQGSNEETQKHVKSDV